MFGKITSFIRLPGICANSNEAYRRYNLPTFANIFGNCRKISGIVKFPENLQPHSVLFHAAIFGRYLQTISDLGFGIIVTGLWLLLPFLWILVFY